MLNLIAFLCLAIFVQEYISDFVMSTFLSWEAVLVSTRTIGNSIAAVGQIELRVHAQYQSLVVRGRVDVIVGNQVKVHHVAIVVAVVVTVHAVAIGK